MNILKNIWNNIVAASFGMFAVALVHLLVWGDHIKGAGTPVLILFFLIFQTMDIIKWGTEKYRERV